MPDVSVWQLSHGAYIDQSCSVPCSSTCHAVTDSSHYAEKENTRETEPEAEGCPNQQCDRLTDLEAHQVHRPSAQAALHSVFVQVADMRKVRSFPKMGQRQPFEAAHWATSIDGKLIQGVKQA